MCVNCGDFVTYCGLDECYNPDGGPYGKFRKFYIGDTYCRHMRVEFGHDIATWEDQIKDDDDD